MKENDLQWLVGFWEGEGSIVLSRWNICLSASQKTDWPLQKILKITGLGKIYRHVKKSGEYAGKGYYRWEVINENARKLILEMYPHLSPRRQEQIDSVLARYLSRPKKGDYQRLKTECKKGHTFSKENTYIKSGKYRECRTCSKEHKKLWYTTSK